MDTTGGADGIISALAVCLCTSGDIIQAISYANYAAGISFSNVGVQSALASKEQMDGFALLKKLGNG